MTERKKGFEETVLDARMWCGGSLRVVPVAGEAMSLLSSLTIRRGLLMWDLVAKDRFFCYSFNRKPPNQNEKKQTKMKNKLHLTITNDPTADHDINTTFNNESDLLHFLENRWIYDEDYGPMIVVGNDGVIEIHNASELLSALKKHGELGIDFDDCYCHIKLEIL